MTLRRNIIIYSNIKKKIKIMKNIKNWNKFNENIKELKPINFVGEPVGSIFDSAEAETVARNIMVILYRTGNEFRKLSWEEYKKEREKDEPIENFEKDYFEEVSEYCISAEKALEFCDDWDDEYLNPPYHDKSFIK